MRILIELDGGVPTITHWTTDIEETNLMGWDPAAEDYQPTLIFFDHDAPGGTEPLDCLLLDDDACLSPKQFELYIDKMQDAHFENV